MKEIDLSIRNSTYYVIWTINLKKKKKMLWLQIMKIFFYSDMDNGRIPFGKPATTDHFWSVLLKYYCTK